MISEECLLLYRCTSNGPSTLPLLPKLLVLVDMVVFLVHLYNNKHSSLIISAGLRVLGLYIYIYTGMIIGDDYVVRMLPNKRLYTRYCSCSCWYEDK